MTCVLSQTPKQYESMYINRATKDEHSRFHGYTYDGIWAMAKAISIVLEEVNEALFRPLSLQNHFFSASTVGNDRYIRIRKSIVVTEIS